MPPEDNYAPPLTPGEIKEALVRFAQAAREAGDIGHTLLQAKRHRQINDLLTQLETIQLEAAFSTPLERLLARIELPSSGPPFAVGP